MTASLEDNEPLKWKIREAVSDVVVTTAGCFNKGQSGGAAFAGRIGEELTAVVMLLNVAEFAGLLSPMNCQVVQKEIVSLRKAMNELLSPGEVSTGQSITRLLEDNDDSSVYRALLSDGIDAREDSIKDKETENIKDIAQDSVLNEVSDTNTVPIRSSSIKAREDFVAKKPLVETKIRPSSPVLSTPRVHNAPSGRPLSSNRRELILEYLRKNGISSIKDIAQVIDGVSEKTVQRELLALVDEGVLRKEGERRWSRYALAQ